MTEVVLTAWPTQDKQGTLTILTVPVDSLTHLNRKTEKVKLNDKNLNLDELLPRIDEKWEDFDRVNFVSGAAKMSYEYEGVDLMSPDPPVNRNLVLRLGDLRMRA